MQPLRGAVRADAAALQKLGTSDNLGLHLGEAEMQLIERVRDFANARTMKNSFDVDMVIAEVEAEMPQWKAAIPSAMAFVRHYGAPQAPLIAELAETYAILPHGCSAGQRRLGPDVLQACAALPAGYPFVAGTAIRACWLGQDVRAGVCQSVQPGVIRKLCQRAADLDRYEETIEKFRKPQGGGAGHRPDRWWAAVSWFEALYFLLVCRAAGFTCGKPTTIAPGRHPTLDFGALPEGTVVLLADAGHPALYAKFLLNRYKDKAAYPPPAAILSKGTKESQTGAPARPGPRR